MAEFTPYQYVELSKIIYCLNLDQFTEMMGREGIDHDADPYILDKFTLMKKDLFRWLCELDSGNQSLVFDYAAKRYEWQVLRHSS